LVQKSVTFITNFVGQLSSWMLGKIQKIRKWKLEERWQSACQQLSCTMRDILFLNHGHIEGKVTFSGQTFAGERRQRQDFGSASQHFVQHMRQTIRALLNIRDGIASTLGKVVFVCDIQCRKHGNPGSIHGLSMLGDSTHLGVNILGQF
jgi:hypothetical protein